MKTLVTGANGFTGAHLVRALLQRGDTVVGFVRQSSDLSRLTELSCELAYGDITDVPALEAAMTGVDIVFHTAAYVELGLVDTQRMERVNVGGTQAVLVAARAAGVSKLVYCSTIGVYGDTQGRVIDETFQRQQPDFSSAYDRTKYLAQQAVDAAAAEGFHTVSVMPSGIFGADDPHFGPAVQLFLKGRLKVWAGGGRITGIVHVDDLVQAMLLAAERAQPGDHYIISAGELSTLEMFQFLGEQVGIAPPKNIPAVWVRLAGNLLDPIGKLLNWQPPISRERVHYLYDRCVRVDASKARRELGWQPRSVQDTLKDLI
ncbi:NAD-dependent epimerase/dehydratase family protein [Synechococcales cyanobacterium C]|uniref:NAD-dependent epimerase/dehydratase family protein n=1 Tax=Petrachloros mirabilis ULC683 TaxID=2781853 RepID=A0A8K2A0R7_9CYAN|nr:NAD-dependent epimerase/dehydratase family protein [Petrachloros mirabilis]NCJ07466.1 NAD-dependent epimerase/dehydratase family protein [Petrachloros mirabilis ULC683]